MTHLPPIELPRPPAPYCPVCGAFKRLTGPAPLRPKCPNGH